jgi:hypothetical protein
VLTKVLAALTIVACIGIATATWCGGFCPYCSTTDPVPTETSVESATDQTQQPTPSLCPTNERGCCCD